MATYVDGGNASVLDTERFLNDLDDWSETIGRTRSVGNDFLVGEFFVVATENNIQSAFFFYWSRNDDLLDAPVQIGLQSCDRQELARALHNELNA